jgi:hypothetical protein
MPYGGMDRLQDLCPGFVLLNIATFFMMISFLTDKLFRKLWSREAGSPEGCKKGPQTPRNYEAST